MREARELKALIDTVEELVRVLTEQVAQKDHQCQVLTEQLADQIKQTDKLRDQLVQQQADTRNAVILFPKTPAT